MPDGLKDHLRYPEDLFRIQTDVYATYHVVEPRRFFQGSERWLISPDPNEAISGVTTLGGTGTDTAGQQQPGPVDPGHVEAPGPVQPLHPAAR